MFLRDDLAPDLARGSRSGTQSSLVTSSAGRTFGAGSRWHSRQNAMLSGFS